MQAGQEMNKQIDEANEIRNRMAALVGGSGSKQTKNIRRERIEEEPHEPEAGNLGTPTARQTKRAKTYDLTGDD